MEMSFPRRSFSPLFLLANPLNGFPKNFSRDDKFPGGGMNHKFRCGGGGGLQRGGGKYLAWKIPLFMEYLDKFFILNFPQKKFPTYRSRALGLVYKITIPASHLPGFFLL